MNPFVIITSNGPGELNTWAKPIALAIKKHTPDVDIYMQLLPCQYASGSEYEIADSWGVLAGIFRSQGFFGDILFGNGEKDRIFKGRKGVVIYAGGDQFYPVLMAKRYKAKLIGYTETEARWLGSYDRFFAYSDKLKGEKIININSLMVDSFYLSGSEPPITTTHELIEYRDAKWDSMDGLQGLKILVLPGSRGWQIDFMLPFFVSTIMAVLSKANLYFSIMLPDNITDENILKALSALDIIASVNATEGLPYPRKIILDGMINIPIYSTNDKKTVMLSHDVAMTIPGTNTAELGIAGIPFLAVFPLNDVRYIPLEGALAILNLFPALKQKVILKHSQNRLFALPNIRAKKLVVPEMVGILEHWDVAMRFLEYINNLETPDKIPLEETSIELIELAGAPEGAQMIAKWIEDNI